MSVRPVPRWAWLALVATLVFAAWWRGHTFAPAVKEALGFAPWPVVRGESEPLDCDEAAYAYIGRRIAAGDVMYRDLTENKPPGGYWLYALAVAIGGANELVVRLLPVPIVLATIVLVWWLALRLGGPGAACIAGLTYTITSTDPYLYGNGAQLEQAMNLFATAALAAVVQGQDRGTSHRRWWFVAAGVALGAACLVKQVAALHLFVFGPALLLRGHGQTSWTLRLRDTLSFLVGLAAVGAMVVAVLAWQGALQAAFEDIVRYGGALAALPSEPNAPPFLMRWITGNADPRGNLPPPFGRTTYLVWWGSGSWPFWLAGAASVAWLGLAPRSSAPRRLVAAWTSSAWVQVALPGLFWPHYDLLPLPGMAVAVAVALADATSGILARRGTARRIASMGIAWTLLAALLGTLAIQIRSYLLVPAEELTVRYKGGGQWVFLRELGREAERRTRGWPDRRLFVWGIQAPLYIYGKLDGVTPQVFTDNLIRDRADRNDPLIQPRLERIVRDLRAHPPELIFAGYPPFAGLREVLAERYVPASVPVLGRPLPHYPNGMGLWVRADRADDLARMDP